MKESIGILGAGAHAHEVASYSPNPVSFFAVGHDYLDGDLVDIANPGAEHADTPVVCGIGSPLNRRHLVEQWVGKKFTNVIAPTSYIGPNVTLGKGLQVGPHAIITTNCTIGDHVIINTAATVSHDVTMGDYATLSPGVHLGGGVEIGAGAFLGIGAIVRDKIKIAPGAVIGAGAVLVKDADTENGVYVGNPAKLTRVNDSWLNAF